MQIQRKDLQIGAAVVAVLVVLVALWAVLQMVGDENGEELTDAGDPGLNDPTGDPAVDESAPRASFDRIDEARPLDDDIDGNIDGGMLDLSATGDESPDRGMFGTERPTDDTAVTDSAGSYWDRVFSGEGDDLPVVTRTPEDEDAGSTFDTTGDVSTTGGEPRVASDRLPVDSADANETPTIAGQRSYTVQRGDSFYSIAKDQLGNADLYLKVQRANPEIDPRRLRPGMVIVIPDPSDSAGSSGDTGERSSPAGETRVERYIDPERQYVVEAGDTLSGIAMKLYGESWLWRDILAANEATLHGNPDMIHVGAVLELPELPDGAVGSN